MVNEFKPLNPIDVIDAAAEQDFCRVLVVGVYRNGRVYVASSHSATQFFQDMETARTYVNSLAVTEAEAEKDGGTFEELPSATPSDP